MPEPEKNDDDEHARKSTSEDDTAANSSKGDKEMISETQQAQVRLGLGLKNMYQTVLDEPLPDDMMALLDQLGELDDDAESDTKFDG